MTKRKIFILLTKFNTMDAKLLSFLTNSTYTHASIGLEENLNKFYSFVGKGFLEEEITKYIKPHKQPFKCILYELEVSNNVYDVIKNTLNKFKKIKNDLKYTKLGVILCVLHIPYNKKNKYFCSHFVATILNSCNVLKLNKNSSLYLPKDFAKIPNIKLKFQGNLKQMINRYKLQPD